MTARKPTRAKALGVTDEGYEAMLAAQDGHCALCPSTPKSRRLNVDHDHATGRVRALLCNRCNRQLPTWVTPSWLRRAADYIEQPWKFTHDCADHAVTSGEGTTYCERCEQDARQLDTAA